MSNKDPHTCPCAYDCLAFKLTGPPFPSEEDGEEGSGILSGGRRHDAAHPSNARKGAWAGSHHRPNPPERGAANAEKLLGVPMTGRNRRTVRKIMEMAGE